MLVVGITDDLHCLIYSTYMFMGGEGYYATRILANL